MKRFRQIRLTQLSSRLFFRLYLLLVITIILIGSGLEYVQNAIDHSESLAHTKTINRPVFQLIEQLLVGIDESQWTEAINQYNVNLTQPLLLMRLSDFSADNKTLRQLSDGDVLGLFDIDDSLTLYRRIADSEFVLALDSVLPAPIDQRGWVLPVFYSALALMLYLIIRPFAKQLLQLKQAAVDLGKGDFSARVKVPASTTLAPIADAFNTMTKKIEGLLLNQRDLVNSVSHELRTPLARLKFGFEDLVVIENKDSLISAITAMKNDVKELELLIDEMLRYAEVNQVTDFIHSAVSIKTIIKTLILSSEGTSINITVDVDKEIKDGDTLLCHELSLNRALSNVLRNAISFARTECHIKIRKHNHALMIDINDDGIGLSGVDHERLFEPFYKVDNIKRQPGYGLGLSIAKNIISQHHGSLSVVEGGLGGACFRFMIPT